MNRSKFFAWIVWAFYRLWISTWRISIVESDSLKKQKTTNKPWVIAHWHGDELALICFCRFYKVATITSTSKDGELMNNVLNLLGVKTSRGSSTRGGVGALKGIIRIARTGYCPVVAVDGPKGPFHKAKPGVFEISRMLDLPIISVGVSCSRKYTFEKSWNKTYLPLPFSKLVLVWGEALYLNKEEDPRSPKLAEKLENELDALGRKAAKLFAKH